MKRQFVVAAGLVFGVLVFATLSTLLLWHPAAFAGEGEGLAKVIDPGVLQWGYLAAALATGLSSVGAAFAVASVGAAAVGAIAEKPELFGRVLILVGLAEGIAIYGVIMSVLILNRLG
jgi:V/A-type H+/Na+-transporting ATPase subunit K